LGCGSAPHEVFMDRFPNRTAQEATFKTGTPNYVDASSGSAVAGHVTFSSRATSDSWEDGDRVGLLVVKQGDAVTQANNYKVWVAVYDATNSYLELEEEEDSVGTLADDDSVYVYAVETTRMIAEATSKPQKVATQVVSDTSYRTTQNDTGTLIACTSASAVTVTLDSDLPVGFHVIVAQHGAGAVTVSAEGADTLNGTTAGAAAISGIWKSGYFYQISAGAWVGEV